MIDASQVWHDLHYTHCFASTWCQRSLDLLQGQRRWHPGGHKRCSCGRRPGIGLHELSRCRIRRQRRNQPRRTHTVPRKTVRCLQRLESQRGGACPRSQRQRWPIDCRTTARRHFRVRHLFRLSVPTSTHVIHHSFPVLETAK